MKLYFLSYDCANKSLAVILFSYDMHYKKEVTAMMQSNNCTMLTKIMNINKILNNVIEIFYADVIDICPGIKIKNLNIIQKSNLFKNAIVDINKHLELLIEQRNLNRVHVYIERQPTFNVKSSIVYHQLIYEYSNNKIYKIKVMYPMLKNKVTLRPDLAHSSFISYSNNAYRANKNHTKANFLYFIETFGLQNQIKHIKKKNIDDIADAFLQVLVDIKSFV